MKIGLVWREILRNILFATSILRGGDIFQIADAIMCAVVFHKGVREGELICNRFIGMRVCYRFTLDDSAHTLRDCMKNESLLVCVINNRVLSYRIPSLSVLQ